MTSFSDLLTKKDKAVRWNHIFFCTLSKGIQTILLIAELFSVKKENVWETDIVIFQNPLKHPQVPPSGPRSVWYAQGTLIITTVYKNFWNKILKGKVMYRWQCLSLLMYCDFLTKSWYLN